MVTAKTSLRMKKLKRIPKKDSDELELKKQERASSKVSDLEQAQKDIEELFVYIDRCEKKASHTQRVVNGINSTLLKFMKDFERATSMLSSKLSHQEEVLEKAVEINQIAEETLMNVLLAIRQNEYLQAWYPAQQGFPEQKVVGRHPLQLLQKEA